MLILIQILGESYCARDQRVCLVRDSLQPVRPKNPHLLGNRTVGTGHSVLQKYFFSFSSTTEGIVLLVFIFILLFNVELRTAEVISIFLIYFCITVVLYLEKCPPANVAFGVLVSPASCNYDWQSAGHFCNGSCIDTLAGPGKQAIQCQEDGAWSEKLKNCRVSGTGSLDFYFLSVLSFFNCVPRKTCTNY